MVPGAVSGGWGLEVDLSLSQINALLLMQQSLTLFVRRQLSRLNDRPRGSPTEEPREWWRYAARCLLKGRERTLICTEASGHSWAALWKVLAMRQRYLLLHKMGRYHLPSVRRPCPLRYSDGK